VTVAVSDGRLTVTNGSGGQNNKINFIEVTAVSAAGRAAAAGPVAPATQPAETTVLLSSLTGNGQIGTAARSTEVIDVGQRQATRPQVTAGRRSEPPPAVASVRSVGRAFNTGEMPADFGGALDDLSEAEIQV
jgi:hypothetical protein